MQIKIVHIRDALVINLKENNQSHYQMLKTEETLKINH
jgi:hypothetical protein